MSAQPRFVTHQWEGVFTHDFTLAAVRQHCTLLASTLLQRNWACLIAYDTRFMSNLFAQEVYRLLAAHGVRVRMVDTPTPLPAAHHALHLHHADCALVVSARNSPYWYNGLVLLAPSGASLPAWQSTAAAETLPGPDAPSALAFPNDDAQSPSSPDVLMHDVREPYLDMVRGLIDLNIIRRAVLTIFGDPMNGTLVGYLPAIIGGGQTKAIEINREVDPLFSNFTPLPSRTGLSRLRKLVRESDSHIGLAFSADGTALSVVDKNGELIDPIEAALLLASYMVYQYRAKGVVVAPPPHEGTPLAQARKAPAEWEQALGLKVELHAQPHPRIAELQDGAGPGLLVGCTHNGELIVNPYSPFPDALIAGLLMVELVARGGGSLRSALDDLRARLGISA